MKQAPQQSVTYSPSWTLIPTHYCRDTCGYCVFVEHKGPGAHLLAPAARREIEKARATGAHARRGIHV